MFSAVAEFIFGLKFSKKSFLCTGASVDVVRAIPASREVADDNADVFVVDGISFVAVDATAGFLEIGISDSVLFDITGSRSLTFFVLFLVIEPTGLPLLPVVVSLV